MFQAKGSERLKLATGRVNKPTLQRQYIITIEIQIWSLECEPYTPVLVKEKKKTVRQLLKQIEHKFHVRIMKNK